MTEASAEEVEAALRAAQAAASAWAETPAAERAACLERAAEAMQARMPALMNLAVREAGKTLPNAVGEVREAIDFLRYYARQARGRLAHQDHVPLGPVACISPWNFPLAIFTGQVAAALAAGNPVLAKPAEQTPLVAAEAVRLLHAAGVPRDVLQLLPGAGETVGARLVADARVHGVLFTGSTDVARILQRTVARRLRDDGRPVVLVAETGGQNAMIVDTSALAEQVVADVTVSAFDSAGQRCSALRVLCVQEEVAGRLLEMLRGAMAELTVGDPERLSADLGPVIDEPARRALLEHIEAMRAKGRRVFQVAAHAQASLRGTFVPPTLIEIDSLADLSHEVFGPVLHVLRYRREGLDALIDAINALGYGLTLGIHSRVDDRIEAIAARARVGNIYVNRNIVGAVVGVQPFGGEGLSGTGPKAGGPLYLYRLLSSCPPGAALEELRSLDRPDGPVTLGPARASLRTLAVLRGWEGADERLRELCERLTELSPLGGAVILPGPTGERNSYAVMPRTAVLCLASAEADLLAQLAAVLSVGGRAVWPRTELTGSLWERLPALALEGIERVADWTAKDVEIDAILHHGSREERLEVLRQAAARPGPIASVHAFEPGEPVLALERLLLERVVSVNTAAAGGNASLMTVG